VLGRPINVFGGGRLAGCWKNVDTENMDEILWGRDRKNVRMLKKAVQRKAAARRTASRIVAAKVVRAGEMVSRQCLEARGMLPGVEPQTDASTPLAHFSSILVSSSGCRSRRIASRV
jgi:hypothetical protein